MKFDIVIGNPPYQAPNKNSASLWPMFIRIAYERSKEGAALVVPNRWGGPGLTKKKGKVSLFPAYLRNDLIYANMGECDRHFPNVGPAPNYFSYFVIDKHKEKSTVRICSKVDVFDVDVSDLDCIPLANLSRFDFDIMRKISEYKKMTGKSFYTKSSSYTYRSNGIKKFILTNAMHVNYDKMFKYFDDGTLTNDIELPSALFIVRLDSNSTSESLFSIFDSYLFRYIFKKFFITAVYRGVFDLLPYFDTSIIWNDKKIYTELGLTKKEIEHIKLTLN